MKLNLLYNCERLGLMFYLRISLIIVNNIFACVDLCMTKTQARGIIYREPCDNDKQCQVGCRNPNCGCSVVCMNHVCQCPHEILTFANTVKPPRQAPSPHHTKPPHPHHPHHPPKYQAPPPHHKTSN